MTKTTWHKDVVSGILRFGENTSSETLCELAEEWKAGPDGDRYLDLHVRKSSRDLWCIGFRFRRNDDSQESFKKYVHKMTDQLKRRFGNDFVGWDISSLTFIIT